MSKYIIHGGKKLSGTISVAGNKNAILPIMAASILIHDKVVLTNVPDIKDVKVMGDILTYLGAEVEYQNDNTLKINSKAVSRYTIPVEMAKQLRASVLLIGPLIARFGKVELPHPGGDVIGKRSIDTHLNALVTLGASVDASRDRYKISWNNDFKSNAHIFLDEPSVTTTENILMAVAYNTKDLLIENVALEPHVHDLISFLKKAGLKIEYKTGSQIKITGNKSLQGVSHTVSSDYIEMGTFAALAAATNSTITIQGDCQKSLQSPFNTLSLMGINFTMQDNAVEILASEITASAKRIQSGPHPNFPTDLMSPFIVLATQAKGQTLLHDPMYESRMFFVDKLIRMGAEITICDPHRVIVHGPTQLHPQVLHSPDIRAGMALVIAALCADGESVIENVEIIERGYERLAERLLLLGADIQKHG